MDQQAMLSAQVCAFLKSMKRRLKALQDALIAGEQSGEPKPFDFDGFIARKNSGSSGALTGYILSPAAESDVNDIWDYTVERWGGPTSSKLCG